jgi:hypothetical protein
MTDQYPDAEWFYFAADKSEEVLEDGVPHPLYKADGTLATKTDYADCEFEALNPMPSEVVGMYGRFTTAAFSFATYQSTADVLHVEFTGLHQEEDEYCFADRLRVVVTASPAPALPTVSVSGDFGEDNWLFCDDSCRNQKISPNDTIYISPWGSSASWDNTKNYAVLLWATYKDSQGHGNWGFSVEKGSNNNNFYARNISSDTLYLYCLRVAVCSDSTATVITVYDSSNNPYNAFKYTSDGTDYYYVLDGTQTDWTDDLSGIGYSPAPAAAVWWSAYLHI